MKILKGQYTFATLYKWRKEVASKVFPMDGIYTIGIDEFRNKVFVGVENKSILDKVNEN